MKISNACFVVVGCSSLLSLTLFYSWQVNAETTSTVPATAPISAPQSELKPVETPSQTAPESAPESISESTATVTPVQPAPTVVVAKPVEAASAGSVVNVAKNSAKKKAELKKQKGAKVATKVAPPPSAPVVPVEAPANTTVAAEPVAAVAEKQPAPVAISAPESVATPSVPAPAEVAPSAPVAEAPAEVPSELPPAEVTPAEVKPSEPVATEEPVAAPAETVVAEPAKVETEKESSATVSSASVPAKRRGVPTYQFLRPKWGYSGNISMKGLGAAPVFKGVTDPTVMGALVQFEYQPAFIQSIGVIGLGMSGGIYRLAGSNVTTQNVLGVWEVGGQIRYQARYFREQPVVPYAGFSYERVGYSFGGDAGDLKGAVINSGAFFGGMLLLNTFEPSAAAEFYVNYGVLRSYLFVEYKMISAASEDLTASGNSLFFGLRIEQ